MKMNAWLMLRCFLSRWKQQEVHPAPRQPATIARQTSTTQRSCSLCSEIPALCRRLVPHSESTEVFSQLSKASEPWRPEWKSSEFQRERPQRGFLKLWRIIVFASTFWATRPHDSAVMTTKSNGGGRFPSGKTHLKLHSVYVIKQQPGRDSALQAHQVRSVKLLLPASHWLSALLSRWRSFDCPSPKLHRHDKTWGGDMFLFLPNSIQFLLCSLWG